MNRTAFTLVELLVAITVIGILVGMLAVAVTPALKRAREAAIQMEIQQMSLSIENFKNQYGFYPPSFEGIFNCGDVDGDGDQDDADRVRVLSRYVNRISPNNAESRTFSVAHPGETMLEHWYETVGKNLDQESSLVFWLSGLCKNKQFPLSNGLVNAAGPPLAAHGFANDGIERDIFFEFKSGQLNGDDADETVVVNTTTDTIAAGDSEGRFGLILEYRQASGASNGDLLFKYRDSSSYNLGGGNVAYYAGPADGSEIVNPAASLFANPDTFQLVTFGLDGKSGAPGNWNTILHGDVMAGGFTFTGYEGSDNLTNFAEGTLESWVNQFRD